MSYYTLDAKGKKYEKKTVLLRVDWNVSFDEKKEMNQFRIRASMETIQYLVKQGAYIIIVTHWSRPSGFEYEYSTAHFIKILKEYGYKVTFIPTVSLIESYLNQGKSQIFLLENIRFLPHEKTCSQLLASKLSFSADFFVQDGFGVLAKESCLTTIVPTFFQPEKRCIGFLIEKELHVLDQMRAAHISNNVLVIGGAKVPEKLMALQNALSVASTILLLPPLVITYQAALGEKNSGNAIVYKDLFQVVNKFVSQAEKQKTQIVIPSDFQIKTAHGSYRFADKEKIKPNDTIVGIGPKTVEIYKEAMHCASYAFMTGISGFIAERESWYTGEKLFDAIGSKTKRIIAGGDSVALIETIVGLKLGSTKLLTGGSASFAYLGTGSLVGLCPFKKEDTSLKN